MWILISETIIFGILMSLIVGYFGGWGLGTNKEVKFESTVHQKVLTITKNDNIKNKSNMMLNDMEKTSQSNDTDDTTTSASDNTSSDLTYKLEKESYFNEKDKQTYFRYRLILRTITGEKLNQDQLKSVLVKMFPAKDTNNLSVSSGSNFTDNALIYYGWPSVVNGAGGDITKAENTFSKYKLVVLGNGLEDPSHPDNENTKKIIADLNGKTEFYGYVNLLPLSQDLESITTQIIEWKDMGVKGILIDNASFDYWKTYINNDYNSYKQFLLTIFNYIKSQNLKIILNGWIPEDLVNNLPLTPDDTLTIESYYYSNGVKTDTFANHAKDFLGTINNLTYKPKILCIATAGNNDQTKINEIKDDIGNEMETNCQYRTIQDDYGSDSFASVLTPNN